MTRRAKTTAASNTGSFAASRRNEATGIDLGTGPTRPPYAPPRENHEVVKPIKCRKCDGRGDYTYASGAPGACAPCAGTGRIESDRATIAASKARAAAMASLYDLGVGKQKILWALSTLRETEPERFEKALASHCAGRTDVAGALVAYYDEKNPRPAPAEIAKSWGVFDQLPDFAQEALRAAGRDADDVEWQFARVPVSVMAERVMAAAPDIVADHGTFEAYHDWYMATHDVPDHAGSVWPSIEAPEGTGEYLADGERRFHSYVAQGLSFVPVLRSRPRE